MSRTSARCHCGSGPAASAGEPRPRHGRRRPRRTPGRDRSRVRRTARSTALDSRPGEPLAGQRERRDAAEAVMGRPYCAARGDPFSPAPPVPRLARPDRVRPSRRRERGAGEHAAGVPTGRRPRLPLPRDRRPRDGRRRRRGVPRRRPARGRATVPGPHPRAAVERGRHGSRRRARADPAARPTLLDAFPDGPDQHRLQDRRRRRARSATCSRRRRASSIGCASARSATAGCARLRTAPRRRGCARAPGRSSSALLRVLGFAVPGRAGGPGARPLARGHGHHRARSCAAATARRRGPRLDDRRRRPRWTACSTSASTGS